MIEIANTWLKLSLIEVFQWDKPYGQDKGMLRVCIGGKWLQFLDDDQKLFEKLKQAMGAPSDECS